jgi:formylglycine-generating enzyme required for sulfatase activity
VAKKMPNDWGLYDMAGNAQEWVEDHMSDDLGTDEQVDPVNTTAAEFNRGIIRGGSFAHGPQNMRAAYRRPNIRENRGTSLGVRCVVSEVGPE